MHSSSCSTTFSMPSPFSGLSMDQNGCALSGFVARMGVLQFVQQTFVFPMHKLYPLLSVVYFLIFARKSSMGVAGMLIMCTVPREPSSMETRVIASLSGASTMLTKSYRPSTAYCWRTFAPNASISLLTSLILSGLVLMVFLPSEVRVDKRMYIGMKTPVCLFVSRFLIVFAKKLVASVDYLL